jgi:hypothetical protein
MVMRHKYNTFSIVKNADKIYEMVSYIFEQNIFENANITRTLGCIMYAYIFYLRNLS